MKTQSSTKAEDKRVIVIMPGGMHEQLKTWCDDRGLPLANGIKLAIKDFLDKQNN